MINQLERLYIKSYVKRQSDYVQSTALIRLNLWSSSRTRESRILTKIFVCSLDPRVREDDNAREEWDFSSI